MGLFGCDVVLDLFLSSGPGPLSSNNKIETLFSPTKHTSFSRTRPCVMVARISLRGRRGELHCCWCGAHGQRSMIRTRHPNLGNNLWSFIQETLLQLKTLIPSQRDETHPRSRPPCVPPLLGHLTHFLGQRKWLHRGPLEYPPVPLFPNQPGHQQHHCNEVLPGFILKSHPLGHTPVHQRFVR